MQFAYSYLILVPLVTLAVTLALAARAWRYRSSPAATTFMVLMSALACLSLAVILEHASVGLASKILWVKMSYFGVAIIPSTWLAFTLQYAGMEKWLTRRNLAILIILPVLNLTMVWTNEVQSPHVEGDMAGYQLVAAAVAARQCQSATLLTSPCRMAGSHDCPQEERHCQGIGHLVGGKSRCGCKSIRFDCRPQSPTYIA